jgi:hypothetical protein
MIAADCTSCIMLSNSFPSELLQSTGPKSSAPLVYSSQSQCFRFATQALYYLQRASSGCLETCPIQSFAMTIYLSCKNRHSAVLSAHELTVGEPIRRNPWLRGHSLSIAAPGHTNVGNESLIAVTDELLLSAIDMLPDASLPRSPRTPVHIRLRSRSPTPGSNITQRHELSRLYKAHSTTIPPPPTSLFSLQYPTPDSPSGELTLSSQTIRLPHASRTRSSFRAAPDLSQHHRQSSLAAWVNLA